MPKKIDNLTIIVLTKKAKELSSHFLSSLSFGSNTIFIDDSLLPTPLNFAEKRTLGIKQAPTEWILYLDTDEQVTPELINSIYQIVTTNQIGAYRIRRQNYFLGKLMYDDHVDRFFHRSTINGWTGEVHESPILVAKPQLIEGRLIHHTHLNIRSMLAKTNEWSIYEAKLRDEALHPKMSWWRLIRIGFTFFGDNFFNKKLYKYSREGLFEAYFQAIDKLVVYTKLWELQQKRH